MKPIPFKQQNTTFAETQPDYFPLPAYKFPDSLNGTVAFCWKLTWKERFLILFKGVIWHQVLTFDKPLQPQLLTLERPWFGEEYPIKEIKVDISEISPLQLAGGKPAKKVNVAVDQIGNAAVDENNNKAIDR